MMKKLTAFLLAFALLSAVFLTSCGGGSSAAAGSGGAASPAASGSTAAAGGEPIELTFYAYGFQALVGLPGYEDKTQSLGDAYNLIIDDFVKENPNVSIKLVPINPAGGGTEQLDVDLASGTVPNLYYDSLLRISKYNGLDYLLDMSSYVSPDVTSGFTPGSIEEGALWYMPTGTSPMVMCVNKTMFDELNISDLLPRPDDRNWTVDEFKAALEAVKAANRPDTYPVILWAANQSGDACNMSYLWGFDARFFDGNDFTKTILNNEAGYEALGFLNELTTSGLAVPGAAGLNDDDMWAMWQNGQVAITGGYPYLEVLADEAETPFEPYFVNYPHLEGQPNPPLAPDTHAISVFKSDNEAENEMAAKFAEYMVSSDWAAVFSQALGDMTVHSSLEGKVALTDEGKAAQKMMDENGLLSYGPACPKWSELRPLYASELQAMFSGTKTPQQAADDFAAAANTVLQDG